jgi:hypothetical protein
MIFAELRDESDVQVIPQGFYTKVQAISLLQASIEKLRRETLPTFDASWGEQPMPILGPNSEEQTNLLESLQPSH